MNTSQLYDKDFYAWTVEMATALKNKAISKLDLEHLAEELEGMSARELREIRSRLIVLIMHLLNALSTLLILNPSQTLMVAG